MAKVTIYCIIFLLVGFNFQLNAVSKNFKGTIKDNSRITVVVIDPGHGGIDKGASIGTAHEKDIVLEIALKLGSFIKQNHPDISVIYTRNKDEFIPLHKRADIANKNKADLFISIHVNSVASASVRGTETYVLGLHSSEDNLEVAKTENAVILLEDDYNNTYEGFDPNLPESYIMFETLQEEYQEQSVLLASHIQDEFRKYANRVDRSVKMAGFLVLRRTTMPSILIETGFLSHANERTYLLSQSGQTMLANSIYRAFNNYKLEIENRSEFNFVPEIDAAQSVNTDSVKEQIIEITEQTEAVEPETTKPLPKEVPPTKQETVEAEETKPDDEIYFSVQIIALKRNLEPTPENFSGEQNIFRVKSPYINRYFSGKFSTLEQAQAEKNRIEKIYKNAYVVAFKNNALISVKKALQTR